MNIGDKVICSKYIKPSGNHYEIIPGKETQSGNPECFYLDHVVAKETEVEDFHSCERYKTISKEFTGIYVGTTTLCTKLNAEWFDPEYGNCGFRTFCDQPKKFGIVYYADNKKRLVPIEKISNLMEDKLC